MIFKAVVHLNPLSLKPPLCSDLTSRSLRRMDWRTHGEAPARECPRSKLNHRLDVLDVSPGELQWHHRVRGVAHLPETKGEPEAGKAVLHSGKGKEGQSGSLTSCSPASQQMQGRHRGQQLRQGLPGASRIQRPGSQCPRLCNHSHLPFLLELPSSFYFHSSFKNISWAPMMCWLLEEMVGI